jgi:hypothetical protein
MVSRMAHRETPPSVTVRTETETKVPLSELRCGRCPLSVDLCATKRLDHFAKELLHFIE